MQTALCQVNLCVDNRYVAISKWLSDCVWTFGSGMTFQLTERRICEAPDIEAYDVTIGVTIGVGGQHVGDINPSGND